MTPLIEILSPTLRYTGITITGTAGTLIPAGVSVVIGPNGAGKTALARILERGWNFMQNAVRSPRGRIKVRYVEFSDIHSLAGFKAEYYQQRYEAGMNIEVPTVRTVMGSRLDDPEWRAMAAAMRLGAYEDKPMNALSSGELRKLLIINQLTDAPALLILDNPYIGLDPEARAELDAAMERITASGTVSIMLLLANINEVPPFAATLLPMDRCAMLPAIAPERKEELRPLFSFTLHTALIPAPPAEPEPLPAGVPLVQMRSCRAAYGPVTVQPAVNWSIMPGEKWILAGPNGSGKSTILSLIHADNPQAYANDISLFGRRRGTGESIWDVKRRIGYVSPEMHLYFNGGHSQALHVVAQGLNDTVGQYRRLTPGQLATAAAWLRCLQMDHLAERPFRTLSRGEQRMLLLARTLIKQPPLLILDEPLHGLDQARKQAVRTIIDTLAARRTFALIYVTHRREEAPACATLIKELRRYPC